MLTIHRHMTGLAAAKSRRKQHDSDQPFSDYHHSDAKSEPS